MALWRPVYVRCTLLGVDTLRKLPFFIAIAAIAIAVIIEMSSSLHSSAGAALAHGYANPGLGIRYLALIHGIVLFNALYMGLALLSRKITGSLQGIITLILSLGIVIGGIVLIFVAFTLLMIMVSLLLATPFGTIAYFALFADFPTGRAAASLGAIMFLTLVFAGGLLLAQQGFLKSKRLIALVLTALVATFLVRLLISFVPGFLASITDAIAAIVVAFIAVLWGVYMLIGAIGAIVRLVRGGVALA